MLVAEERKKVEIWHLAQFHAQVILVIGCIMLIVLMLQKNQDFFLMTLFL